MKSPARVRNRDRNKAISVWDKPSSSPSWFSWAWCETQDFSHSPWVKCFTSAQLAQRSESWGIVEPKVTSVQQLLEWLQCSFSHPVRPSHSPCAGVAFTSYGKDSANVLWRNNKIPAKTENLGLLALGGKYHSHILSSCLWNFGKKGNRFCSHAKKIQLFTSKREKKKRMARKCWNNEINTAE